MQLKERLEPQFNPIDQATPVIAPLILLAEDNDSHIELLSDYLTVYGFRVKVAKTGWDAIEQAQTVLPDLILMDIQLPGIDGLNAIQSIRANPDLPRMPIIALTAFAMPSDREKCLNVGATEYLSKPLELKQLVTLIQKLLAL
jgi:CheY-like chemotaxis protein